MEYRVQWKEGDSFREAGGKSFSSRHAKTHQKLDLCPESRVIKVEFHTYLGSVSLLNDDVEALYILALGHDWIV